MKIAKNIISIFQHYLPIIFSWGYHEAVALENGLQFRVNGYKHQGKVRVLYNEGLDLFDIVLIDLAGNEIKREEGIYLDCLVNVIDGLVERTDDYAVRVRKQYGV